MVENDFIVCETRNYNISKERVTVSEGHDVGFRSYFERV